MPLSIINDFNELLTKLHYSSGKEFYKDLLEKFLNSLDIKIKIAEMATFRIQDIKQSQRIGFLKTEI